MCRPTLERAPAYSLLFCVFFLASVELATADLAAADAPLAGTHTLEGLVGQWVELRREVAEEEGSWEEQRAQLEQERDLLLKAKDSLEREIAAAEEEQRSADSERAGLRERREALKGTLDACLPALRQAEADLRGWRSLWPRPLLTVPVRKAFDQLRNAPEESVTRRLQVILSLYGEIERLQYGVHVVKEVLKIDAGLSREMDVMYLGLAQGFAVSVDDELAGIGRPVGNGWEWTWRPEIAAEVRQAIAFYRRERTADFVHLPLRVGEVTSQ